MNGLIWNNDPYAPLSLRPSQPGVTLTCVKPARRLRTSRRTSGMALNLCCCWRWFQVGEAESVLLQHYKWSSAWLTIFLKHSMLPYSSATCCPQHHMLSFSNVTPRLHYAFNTTHLRQHYMQSCTDTTVFLQCYTVLNEDSTWASSSTCHYGGFPPLG